jgi:hypothetical protein
MNEQIDLTGEPVPVEVSEKVTTSVSYKADYFKATLSDEKVTKAITLCAEGKEEKAEEIIVKSMKAHRGIPKNIRGKAFKDDFNKIRGEILEQPVKVDAELVESQIAGSAEMKALMSPEAAEAEVGQDDTDIKAIMDDLLTRDEDVGDYLVNNFNEETINKIAARFHLNIEKDELPQTTALNIAIVVNEFKSKAIRERGP